MTSPNSLATASELARRLAEKEETSAEITARYLDRIDSHNASLGAIVTAMADAATESAAASDARRINNAPLSPIDGVPIVIKDNICTQGERTTCASKMLEQFRPPYDATVVRRLREAGAVIIGKANLDEFAMGSSNEFSAFGGARNPWDTDRVPGGSSGGSAVAVAGGLAPWALGSDTGGSIRQPAGFCGIVGLKPTYGRVSRYGLVAFASSLDQIGPMTVDVRDAALLLDAIAGHDKMDSTSSPLPAPACVDSIEQGSLKGLKVGRPVEFFEAEGLDPEIKAACVAVLNKMEAAGAEIIDIHMPTTTEFSISTYYVIATAEASSNLGRYDGAHYGFREPETSNIVEMFSRTRDRGFGDEVKRRIMLGTFVLSAETFDAYYLRALKARTLIQREYREALEKVDVIAAPVAPTAAFKAGSKTGDPVQMYLADIYTLSLNLAGYSGVSIPAGFDADGLPIGFQLFAGPFEELKLLQAAYQLERELGVVNTRVAQHAAV